MFRAVGAMVGKSQVGSAMGRRHGQIIGAEIADVEFVDTEVAYAG